MKTHKFHFVTQFILLRNICTLYMAYYVCLLCSTCVCVCVCVCHLCGLCVPERRRLCIVSGFIKYYALLTCKCNDSSALWAAFESEINMETLWLNWLKVRTEIRLISLSPYSIFFLSLSKKGQHKQEKRGEKLRFVCKEKLAAAKIHVCVATFSRFRRRGGGG